MLQQHPLPQELGEYTKGSSHPDQSSNQTKTETRTEKLRRERDKQLTRRARHNGSRNFAKTRSSHGKIKHKEKLDQEY